MARCNAEPHLEEEERGVVNEVGATLPCSRFPQVGQVVAAEGSGGPGRVVGRHVASTGTSGGGGGGSTACRKGSGVFPGRGVMGGVLLLLWALLPSLLFVRMVRVVGSRGGIGSEGSSVEPWVSPFAPVSSSVSFVASGPSAPIRRRRRCTSS